MNATVQNLTANAMQIVKLPQVPQGGPQFKADANLFGLYDSNGGSPLGIVKRNFNLIQPGAVIEEVARCLSTINGLEGANFEYSTQREGARHRLNVHVKDIEVKLSQRKLKDITGASFDVRWGYDGWTPYTLSGFLRRLVCLNGMSMPEEMGKIRFKNYSNSGDKLTFACEQFAEVVTQIDQYKEFAQRLDKLVVDDKDIAAAMAKVMGTDPQETANIWLGKAASTDKPKTSDAKLATLADIRDSIVLECDRTGFSAWGLLNGFTHFTNHKEAHRTATTTSEVGDRLDYIIYGGGAEINQRASSVVRELLETA